MHSYSEGQVRAFSLGCILILHVTFLATPNSQIDVTYLQGRRGPSFLAAGLSVHQSYACCGQNEFCCPRNRIETAAGLEEVGDHIIRRCGGEKHRLIWKRSSGNSKAADSAACRFHKRPQRYPPTRQVLTELCPTPSKVLVSAPILCAGCIGWRW